MAWAIITNYTSKCAQMDPQLLPKTSKFYSRSKKCDIEKTLGGWVPPPPLGSPKVNGVLIWKGYLFSCRFEAFDLANEIVWPADVSYSLCHDVIIYSCQQILMSYIGQHRGLL